VYVLRQEGTDCAGSGEMIKNVRYNKETNQYEKICPHCQTWYPIKAHDNGRYTSDYFYPLRTPRSSTGLNTYCISCARAKWKTSAQKTRDADQKLPNVDPLYYSGNASLLQKLSAPKFARAINRILQGV
jgi:hypothetical protein